MKEITIKFGSQNVKEAFCSWLYTEQQHFWVHEEDDAEIVMYPEMDGLKNIHTIVVRKTTEDENSP